MNGKWHDLATQLLVAEFEDNGSVRSITYWLVTKVPTRTLPGSPAPQAPNSTVP